MAKKTSKSSVDRSKLVRKQPHFRKGFKRGYQPVQSAALLGNNFWEKASKLGQERIFKTPGDLFENILDYFKSEDSPKWFKKEVVRTKDGHEIVDIPLVHPYTMQGLAIHLGVSTPYLYTFRTQLKEDDPHREGFIKVLDWAEEVIYRQKMQGAAVGAFNANLIGYDLKIRTDNPTVVNNGNGGASIVVSDEKESEKIKKVKAKLNELDKKLKK
jgi:hypothetical protein